VVGKMEDGFKDGLEKYGYVALGWSEAGFVYLMSTVPVDTLELLRKAKVWIWNDSPMAKAIFEEAGVMGCRCPSPTFWSAYRPGWWRWSTPRPRSPSSCSGSPASSTLRTRL